MTFSMAFVGRLAAGLLLCGLATSAGAQKDTQTGAQTGDLSGHWKLVGWTLPGNIPVKGHLPTLTFEGTFEGTFEAGRVSGDTGCNRLNGSYRLSGQNLTFGPLATTRMACEDDLNQQEQTLLAALSGKTLSAVRNQDSLTLTTAEGYMLNIRRSTVQDKVKRK